MEMSVLLSSSHLCRLCGQENKNGINLYTSDESSVDLYTLVNIYLPLKVDEDDEYPKTICPGCHIQLESTKLFMDLIIEGQTKLRSLLKAQKAILVREEAERMKLEQALQNHNTNARVETYSIQSDENGEKFIIQIYTDGPLFSEDHPLHLKVAGSDKPKRRKGRPRKESVKKVENDESPHEKEKAISSCIVPEKVDPMPTEKSPAGRLRRNVKPPARFAGVVQGKELTQILKNQGVIENAEEIGGFDEEKIFKNKPKQKVVIGKVVEKLNGTVVDQELIFGDTKRGRNKQANNKTYSCKVCAKKFKNRSWRDLHEKAHLVDLNKSQACTLEDSEKQSENYHREISTSENNGEGHFKTDPSGDVNGPFRCDICDKTFAYSCTLDNHTATHLKISDSGHPQKFKCKFCEKTYRFANSLDYHVNIAHSNKSYVCLKCNKTFKHRQLLHRHQAVHTDDKDFKCADCNKLFKSKYTLAAHMSVHKGVRFVCSVCDQEFMHKHSLMVHLRIHTGSKPYECVICKKKFTQSGNLKEHERIHTGEKPYPCSVCELKFTTLTQCKIHMRRHTGDRPYACTHCPKKFPYKHGCDIHIRRHLGVKPFSCKQCTRTFTDSWTLIRHERTHTDNTNKFKKQECSKCDKSFFSNANYNRHMKTHLKKSGANMSESVESRTFLPKSDIRNEIMDQSSVSEDHGELQIQILDEEGNTFSLTSTNGEAIPIVSSANDELKGLLPDGTFVSFDIVPDQKILEETDGKIKEEIDISEVNLGELHFVAENSNNAEDKPAFLSEDGKVCFITAFDGSSFLN
ncbi:zinc finger protein 879-like isoform X1 [Euwallacea fornicatus]|uniref:zinc finger protein 879-like isoform X1 n=2 Tax=Euwallacea fornicatus TaxID=995702 RepID=UPI00338F0173